MIDIFEQAMQRNGQAARSRARAADEGLSGFGRIAGERAAVSALATARRLPFLGDCGGI